VAAFCGLTAGVVAFAEVERRLAWEWGGVPVWSAPGCDRRPPTADRRLADPPTADRRPADRPTADPPTADPPVTISMIRSSFRP
jgi:hypothetical protein